MGGSYSIILRERAIKFVVEEGGSKNDACKVLGIGIGTLYNWLKKYKKEGTVAPKPRGNYRTRKVDIIRLKQLLEESPDATLDELATPFGVYPSTIDFHLRRLKITRKKNDPLRRKKGRETTGISCRNQTN